MRASAVLKLALVSAAVAAVAIVAVVKSIDVQGYRRLIAEAVAAQTGRELTFGGEFRLAMSLRPRLVATNVGLANGAGGSRADMLRVARIEAEIGLLSLLRREVEVQRLVLSGVDLLLEHDAKGRPNWEFAGMPAAIPAGGNGIPHTSIRLGRIDVSKMTIGFHDARNGTTGGAVVDSLKIDAEAGPLAFAAAGSFEQRRFDVSGVLGSIADLSRPARPFTVRLTGTIGSVAATVDGGVAEPLIGKGLDLRLAIEGADFAEAGALLRRSLPALGPFRAIAEIAGSVDAPRLVNVDAAVGKRDTVRLTARGDLALPLAAGSVTMALSAEADNAGAAGRAFGFDLPATQPLRAVAQLASVGDGWRLSDLRGTIGRSDVSGQIHVITGGDRPVLSATLASRRIDFVDLGFEGKGESTAKAPGALLFSDEPLTPRRFGGTELDLAWRANEVAAYGVTMKQAVGRLAVHDGFLRLEPFSAQLGEGRLLGSVTVDGTGAEPTVAVVVDAQGIEIGKLAGAVLPSGVISGGRGDVRISVGGTGPTMRAIAADLDGEASLVLGDGAVDKGRIDAYALERLRQVAPWMPREDVTVLNCLVSRFDIRGGRAESHAFLLDASNATMGGEFVLDLKDMVVRATLVPRVKEANLIGLVKAITLSGPLSDLVMAQDETADPADADRIILPVVLPVEAGRNACVVALHGMKAMNVTTPPIFPGGGTLSGSSGNSR